MFQRRCKSRHRSGARRFGYTGRHTHLNRVFRKGALVPFRSAGTDDVHEVLSLDELGAFADAGSNPAETLMNVVGADREALPHRRLFRVSAGARSRQPGPGRHRRPAARVHRHAAPRPARRPGRAGGRAGAPGRRGAGADASALQVLPRGRRGTVPVVSRRAADRPRRAAGRAGGADARDARTSRDDEIEALTRRPRRWRRSSARRALVHRFIAPAQEQLWALARNLWWSWDQDSASLFRDLDPARWRELNHNPISLLSEMPLAQLEKRAGELALHSRINYAYRRQREYLQADQTWGATHAGVLRPRPVGLLLGRVRPARVAPDLLRRPRRAGRRSHQERLRPRHPAGRHRPVLRPGLLPAAARPQRLAARGVPRAPTSTQLPMEPAIGDKRRAGHGAASRPAAASSPPRCGA